MDVRVFDSGWYFKRSKARLVGVGLQKVARSSLENGPRDGSWSARGLSLCSSWSICWACGGLESVYKLI